MKFNVLINEIRAAMLFASHDESRYVLNGVHFEIRPGKAPILAATDGRRLAVIESQAPQDDGELPTLDLTLNAAELSAACNYFKPHCKTLPSVTIEYHPDVRVVLSVPMHHTIDIEKGAVVDGVYPKWRQVIPNGDKEPVPAIAVNAQFVGDFAKAAKLLKSHGDPVVSFNLYSSAKAMDVRISAIPSFYGVIMPCKMLDEERWQPDFLADMGIQEAEKEVAA